MADERDELEQIEILHGTSPRPQWGRKPKYGGHPDMPRMVKSPRKHPEVVDYEDILGIPRRELTPAVEQAIARLSEEVEHERREAELAREHAAHLEEITDRHSFLPLMNRRAFLRELKAAIGHVGRTGARSSLVLVHLQSAEGVRRHFGRQALDRLLYRVAETLMAQLRGTDVGGGLGGDDFGVILALAGADGGPQKAQRLKETLEALTPTWRGEAVAVEVAVGVRVIGADDTVDSVIEGADEDLRHQEDAARKRATETPWERKGR